MVFVVCTPSRSIAACIHYIHNAIFRKVCVYLRTYIYDEYVRESKTGNVEIIGGAAQIEFIGLWYVQPQTLHPSFSYGYSGEQLKIRRQHTTT